MVTAIEPLIQLPGPKIESETSLESALYTRRSRRAFTDDPLTVAELSQLVWAVQGITDSAGHRTVPSAGALYPLEVYVISGNVEGLLPGVYHYSPMDHSLRQISTTDKRKDLSQAALGHESVADGAAIILIAADYDRTTVRYGERGIRYVHMEAGCAAQNIYLQAESLNLGTVLIGAFHDDQVSSILDLPVDEEPLWLMPIGRSAGY